MRAALFGFAFDVDVHGGRDRCAVDERAAGAVREQGVAARSEDGAHGGVVADNGDDDVGGGGDFGEGIGCGGLELGGELLGACVVEIIASGYTVVPIVQAFGHVRTHASGADDSDGWLHAVGLAPRCLGVLRQAQDDKGAGSGWRGWGVGTRGVWGALAGRRTICSKK